MINFSKPALTQLIGNMFDFLLKGKNFDTEVLRLLKEKISIKIELKGHHQDDLTVSLFYKDDKGIDHLITSSTVRIAVP